MVQKLRTPSIISIFGIALVRVILLAIVAVLTWFTGYFFWDTIKVYLDYQTPEVFLSFATDLVVIFGLGLTFWGSIIFGVLGRWWDYLLIIILTGLSFYIYIFIEENTSRILLGLAAAAILGNAIGFTLKLLRQKFLPQVDI